VLLIPKVKGNKITMALALCAKAIEPIIKTKLYEIEPYTLGLHYLISITLGAFTLASSFLGSITVKIPF